MILIDANLLLYAKFADLPQHSAARSWLESRFNLPGKIGLPWHSLLAFLRLATNARLFQHPMTIDAAWAQVEEWIDHSRVWIPEATEDHSEILGNLLTGVRATGNLVSDAHLAALAIEHGLTLYSSDSDFAKFRGVEWVNPLATA